MAVRRDGWTQSDGSIVDMMDVADGEFAKRVGDEFVGAASAPPSGAAGGVLSGTYPDPGFAVDMATQAELDAVAAAKQSTSEKDQASGYAGLNASSRTTKGVVTTDYLIVDLATKGLVIKDTATPAHYWLLSVSTLGVLSTTDLGTSLP